MPAKEDVWQALIAAFPEPDDTDAYIKLRTIDKKTNELIYEKSSKKGDENVS